jgi:hypothetical protein
MHETAQTTGEAPDRLSFTSCFQILADRLPECSQEDRLSLANWYASLLWEMNRERIEPRRNRSHPRVIKRKMSNWKKKRLKHYHPAPLKKPFWQSVVMLR